MQGEFNAGIEARLAALEAQAGTISDTQAAQIKQSILDSAYPVGSIYTSVNTTNPGTLFGGTWERLKGKFLLGADDSTYKNGGTGGAATINLEHSHTTGDHKLIASEIPQHKHSVGVTVADSFFYIRHGAGASTASVAAGTNTTVTEKSGDTWGNGFSTSGYSHKIDRVTIKHVPKVTESNVGSNGTHNHGNTGNKLSTAQSIMPPYLVVYMWKRTA